MTIITKSAEETAALAKKILKRVLEEAGPASPLVFYLTGELGAGKTHFVKGLAEAIGIADNITSPTFVLMKKFLIPKGHRLWVIGYRLFFHIDCYRIYDAEDARQIGLDEIFKNQRAIIAVEWAERVAEIIPRPYWKIKFEHIEENKRKIVTKNVRR